ncbi:HAD family hydrolase [Brevibacillus sp. B_LB10_24]|uniref:HAD family hydrolase n=1 Tax=Brevibacillus sp. B_LB10_24 TaxID=3380645 RepID=UPI0038BDF2AE
MKRWITFDLDGTLMQNPFQEWVFPEIDAIVAAEAGSATACDARGEMIAEHERRLARHMYVEAYDWDDILSGLLERLGLVLAIDIEQLVIKHSCEPKVSLLEEGVLDALAALKAGGYALAAVTNGYFKFQYPVMQALGLADLFDAVVTPDRVGFAKPDVRIFDTLCRQGGIAAHVGDRIDHDVCLANRFGTCSVLIDRRLPPELADMNPFARATCEAGKQFCEKKARAEQISAEPGLWAPMLPKAVIGSLTELAGCLEKR